MAVRSPYSRPRVPGCTRRIGRSINFQTPSTNLVDPVVGETSAVNNVRATSPENNRVARTICQVASGAVPPDGPTPETPGNEFHFLCALIGCSFL